MVNIQYYLLARVVPNRYRQSRLSNVQRYLLLILFDKLQNTLLWVVFYLVHISVPVVICSRWSLWLHVNTVRYPYNHENTFTFKFTEKIVDNKHTYEYNYSNTIINLNKYIPNQLSLWSHPFFVRVHREYNEAYGKI